MRARAKEIFMAGVAAADPYLAVENALRERPMRAASEGGKTIVLAVGKAAMRMAQAANDLLSGDVGVVVITNYENAKDVDFARVYAAGHPVPDQNGARAAIDVITVLKNAGASDRILALISGGGSALLPAPVAGIALQDKAQVSRLLLGCGAQIGEMNLVRQQLSRLKGGGFLRFAGPAPVRALILSDVVGDDFRLIASGLTAAAVGGKKQAVELLKFYGIWCELPMSVQTYLLSPQSELPTFAKAENQLVGSNSISLSAMKRAAPEAYLCKSPLIGDVQQAAEIIAESNKSITLFGGETTVCIRGNGLGGRNQELALRLAVLAEKQGWPGRWVFLSGGTDGRDGPCDAAGAIVDNNTLTRMRAAGVSPEEMLANNDSYHALKASGDLLMTGATGTNVADLQVLIR
jgi:hydroxypyruvate reductase